MEEIQSAVCVNCGGHAAGAYCSTCGQPAEVKRLKFSNVVNEFVTKIVGLDSAFLRTIVELYTRPGKVAMAYIQGNRRMYMGPVAYFLLITTIYILLVNVLDIDWLLYLKGLMGEMDADMSEDEVQRLTELVLWTNKIQRLVALINTFMLALPFWLIFRKEYKINFIESLSACFYYAAQVYVLNILSLLSFKVTGFGFQWLVTTVSLLIPCWLAATMFTPGVSWPNFFKGLVAMVLSVVFVVVAVMVFIVAVLLIFGEDAVQMLNIEKLIDTSAINSK